jgi:hypothetical protein
LPKWKVKVGDESVEVIATTMREAIKAALVSHSLVGEFSDDFAIITVTRLKPKTQR